jgi:hypothetical protein
MGIGLAIIRTLTAHQQRMTELIHQNRTAGVQPELLEELRALRSEVRELRDRVNETAINSDSFASLSSPPSLPDDVSARIRS